MAGAYVRCPDMEPGAFIGPPRQQARTQSEASATRKEVVMAGALGGRWFVAWLLYYTSAVSEPAAQSFFTLER